MLRNEHWALAGPGWCQGWCPSTGFPIFGLTELEDQSVHYEMRTKPEEIWCPPMHTCEAKAPVYPGLWADRRSRNAIYLSSAKIVFAPISTPFSSTFAVKAKAAAGPSLFPQLLCQFKDPDVCPLMQFLAGATDGGSRPEIGVVCVVSPRPPLWHYTGAGRERRG